MSDAIARLVADYEAKKADRKYVDIPLKGGDPLRVFYHTVRTTSQQQAIEKQADKDTGIAGPHCVAEIVLQCALNEDGGRMFPDMTRAELLNKVDYEILMGIVAGIGGVREAIDPKQ